MDDKNEPEVDAESALGVRELLLASKYEQESTKSLTAEVVGVRRPKDHA